MKKTTVSVPPLFGHQEEARALTLAELDVSDRCKVIMACGTGKTRIGPELAIGRDARTVVVYLPSLALMRQTLPDWINAPFVGGSPDILCVCSDSTVADSDAPVVTASELAAEFHKPVTTSSDEVRGFLAAPSKHVRVVFSTYQSSDVVSAGCPDGFAFDMGLFDEAHRTAGKDSAFSGPLLDTHTPISKRVFMTATPKHFNLRKKGKKEAEATVAYSMDDESSYGRVAYRLPIREAIKRGIIADYQVLITVVDDKTIAEKLKARKSKESIEQIAHAFAIKDAMSKYGVTKVVTFHDSVKNAQQFAANAVIQQELGAPTFHVNGSIPTRDRAGIMQQFAATPQALVTNAKCLTEGVDVPAIDMVAFLHPKKSKIDIIQAIGRALRLPRGSKKTTGYILLPIYVSQIEDGGLEKTLDESGFDSIVQVIQALKEQDEVVEAVFREAAKRSRSKQDSTDMGFVKIDGPEVYLNKLRNAITTQCLEYLVESWDAMYELAKEFAHREGHCRVPFGWKTDDGFNLSMWMTRQRSNQNQMSSEHKARLEELPGWSWDVFADKWENGFSYAKEFAHREGHCRVPFGWKTDDGFNLGSWIAKQRSNQNKMSLEHKARLEELPGWSWNPMSDKWEDGFFHSKEFADREGHCRIPKFWKTKNGFNLGMWMATQRANQNQVSSEYKARLETLPGWSWCCPMSDKWENGFFHSKEFADREGHCRIPAKWKTEEGYLLGAWIVNQRIAQRQGALSPERKARLEALPGWSWNPHSDKFEQWFNRAKEYADREGHCRIPVLYKTENGEKLGKWISDQHIAQRQGKLSQERKARLEALPCWSWTGK